MKPQYRLAALAALAAMFASYGLAATTAAPKDTKSPSSGSPMDRMAGMNMSGPSEMKAGTASMPGLDMIPLKMPQLEELGTYVATGKEDWTMRTGFGGNATMVGMMNKMMVGGSGMEGMKMAPMKMDFGPKNFTGARENSLSLATSAAIPPNTAPSSAPPSAVGAPVAANPSGTPVVSGGTSPLAAPSLTLPIKITGAINSPKSGDNVVVISVSDAAGAPIQGAKLTTTVQMTSMDMGTSHPAVKDIGNGKYSATVTFSMSGTWRVAVKALVPGISKPEISSFSFDAK